MLPSPQKGSNHRGNVNHSFKPILRAYALGYVSVIVPRLLVLLRVLMSRRDVTIKEKSRLLFNALRTSLQISRFPTACAIIIGGATLVPGIVASVVFSLRKKLRISGNVHRYVQCPRLFRTTCIFLSAMLAFKLLNRGDSWNRKHARSQHLAGPPKTFSLPNQDLPPPNPAPQLAGKTIDFTLFTSTRALSVLLHTLWARTQSSRYNPTYTNPKLTNLLIRLADPVIFSASAALIMQAWCYSPDQLPSTYNRWIHKAANIDPRFLSAVRLAKTGGWKYGVHNGESDQLLRGVARDLGLPEEWGDPALTVPIRCELVHGGCGPSCELHALWRFWRAWLLGMEMYLPLQLVVRMIRRPNPKSLIGSVAGAARSAAFLGSFVSLFYYGVCLARTRLGPVLLPPTKQWGVSPQTWDGGLCILSGCMLCGWSILIEPPGRRGELALFVLPRALATLSPRVYHRKHRWREGCLFAAGVTVVLDAVMTGKGREERVRGMLGRVLSQVVGTNAEESPADT